MIVKNEQASLPRCLASVRGLADDLVVVDTGSTDRTKKLAQSHGARVFDFTWCEDFSAAYNHSLEQARTDWVLLLDADEELTPESHALVRQAVRREDAFAYTVIRQDFYGENATPDAQTEMLQTRLVRNRPEVRFIGRIHQQFHPSLAELATREGRHVYCSEIRLRHYGYMGDYQTRKVDRTIRLLELELRDRPDRFYYLVELARAYLSVGDAAGIAPLRRAAEVLAGWDAPPPEHLPSTALLLEQVLAADTLPDGFPLCLEQAEAISQAHFPDAVPLLWRRARKRFAAQDFAEGVALLERILHLAETGTYSRHCSFPPEIMGADARLNLAVGYAHLGQRQDAVALLRSLADDPRQGQAARQNLRALSAPLR